MENAYYKLLSDTIRGYNRYTPQKVVNLRANQVFVFGTDRKGSQRYGAAGLASQKFGAEFGVTNGPTGDCYALPTMGYSMEELASAVKQFEEYVRNNYNKTFLITPIGCGHAGLNVKSIAEMFKALVGLNNVMLPEIFIKEYRRECREYFESCEASNNEVESKRESQDSCFDFFDESLHEVISYLIENNIDFDRDGGFSISDDSGSIIAEAELGLESEKIVFLPYEEKSKSIFASRGYRVLTPTEYFNIVKE